MSTTPGTPSGTPRPRHVHLVVVGGSGIGKTAFVNCLLGRPHTPLHNPTALDHFEFSVKVGASNFLDISLWDCGGREEFRDLSNIVLKSAHVVLLAYGIDDESTLKAAQTYWRRKIMSLCKADALFFLVGLKSDLRVTPSAAPLVDAAAAEEVADALAFSYMEASAHDAQSVAAVFRRATHMCCLLTRTLTPALIPHPHTGEQQRGTTTYSLPPSCPHGLGRADRKARRHVSHDGTDGVHALVVEEVSGGVADVVRKGTLLHRLQASLDAVWRLGERRGSESTHASPPHAPRQGRAHTARSHKSPPGKHHKDDVCASPTHAGLLGKPRARADTGPSPGRGPLASSMCLPSTPEKRSPPSGRPGPGSARMKRSPLTQLEGSSSVGSPRKESSCSRSDGFSVAMLKAALHHDQSPERACDPSPKMPLTKAKWTGSAPKMKLSKTKSAHTAEEAGQPGTALTRTASDLPAGSSSKSKQRREESFRNPRHNVLGSHTQVAAV